MAKLTPLSTILSGFVSATKLAANFTKITEAFDNTLSRDGSSPNAMEADLDLNSNRILNLADPIDPTDAITKGYLDATLAGYDFADGEQGEVGPQGPPGPDGDSAYEVAVSNGFVGSEAAWLASLVGPQGTQGNPGTAATIAVGTVSTGAAGSSATITNAGTSSAAVFNFTIPRGDTGASGAGSGDVIGPASATDNAIARFDGTTGKLLQSSSVTISDTGNINALGTIAAGGQVQAAATQNFNFAGRSVITSSADGALEFKNNAGTNINFSIDASGNGVFRGSSVTIGGTAVSLVGHTHAYTDLTSIPASIDAIDGLTPAADRIAYYTSASAATLATLTSFGRSLIDDADAATARTTLGAAATSHTHTASEITDPTNIKTTESLIIAVGDETTAITTGTSKVTFRMPYAFTLTAVRASLTTASSSGLPTVDINEGGVSILSTKLTIDASEKTSTTAATAAVISDSSLADDAEITIDIDVAGTGAAGLKVYLIGRRT